MTEEIEVPRSRPGFGSQAKAGARDASKAGVAPELLFREVNERIAELPGSFLEVRAKLFVCECGAKDCREALELTLSEYEVVRGHGSHFIVMPGHEQGDRERVVEQTERFVVVEKLGNARRLAIAADGRRR